jgi:hypothetical protein
VAYKDDQFVANEQLDFSFKKLKELEAAGMSFDNENFELV